MSIFRFVSLVPLASKYCCPWYPLAPGCVVMLWQSPDMNFPSHPRVAKWLGLGPHVNWGPRHNLQYCLPDCQ